MTKHRRQTKHNTWHHHQSISHCLFDGSGTSDDVSCAIIAIRMSKPSSKSLKNVVNAADLATLQEEYTFVPSEDKPSTWQERMVQTYHDGLYKEYALADLSRAPTLGLRWRTSKEVVDRKGEKSCGNKRCQETSGLVTLEVPFSYAEKGVAKKELVKLRLCPSCKPLVSTRASQNTKEGRRKESRESNRRSRSEPDDDSYSGSSDSDHSRSRQKKRKKRRKLDKKERKKRRK